MPEQPPEGKNEVARAYYQAIRSEPFISSMDPKERWKTFVDLWENHDISAAAICLGDLILTLPQVKRESLLDLIQWAVEGDGEVIW